MTVREHLPPAETMVSELHPDGLWHVRYPTGSLTLCIRPVAAGRRGGVPTCGRCSLVARRWDRIDGSMPAAWRPSGAHASGVAAGLGSTGPTSCGPGPAAELEEVA